MNKWTLVYYGQKSSSDDKMVKYEIDESFAVITRPSLKNKLVSLLDNYQGASYGEFLKILSDNNIRLLNDIYDFNQRVITFDYEKL